MVSKMTPMERVLTTLGHKEPDRVPLFLLLSMYGAKEMDLRISDYFRNPEIVAKAQDYMMRKYDNDCFYTFYYAAIEIEGCGGEVIFKEDGPPNSGEPILKKYEDILTFTTPNIKESPCLKNVLTTTQLLKRKHGNTVPIIGVVMSPFSIPVMQMGFEKYIDLIYWHQDLFHHLMRINEDFCVEWANAQLEAGATAICYFDPVSSPTIIPKELYKKTGFEVAKRTLSRIKGPTATHMASGRVLPIIDDVKQTGTAVIGVSSLEDMVDIKNKCKDKITILGNLNGIEMCNWNQHEAENKVKEIINKGGSGGGLIISDNHGEIPYQVKEDTLLDISKAIDYWGRYPIKCNTTEV